ncbi:unnamed protein product, partial [Brassica rapa]
QTAHVGQNHPKVQGKGQRAESKDQPTEVLCVLMDTHGQPQTSCVCWHTPMDVLCVLADTHGRPVCAGGHPQIPRGLKSPEHSTGRASVQSPRTNVLICVLMDSHEARPVCADGHTRTATKVLCVLTDTHGRPVCADGHPQTFCVY